MEKIVKKYKISLILFGLLSALFGPTSAMKRPVEQEEEPYKPTVPQENPLTGQGYLVGILPEIKAYIIKSIYVAKDLPEAVQAIRAFASTNKNFHALINGIQVVKDLVVILRAKFGGFHEHIAAALATVGAKEYIHLHNSLSLQTVAQTAAMLETAGFDIEYINGESKEILWVALEKRWPLEV